MDFYTEDTSAFAAITSLATAPDTTALVNTLTTELGQVGMMVTIAEVTVAAPSVAYAPQLEQMQYANAVPYSQPVAYVEEAGPLSGSFYAVVGALVAGAVVVAARSQTVAVAAPESESAKNAALIATLAVSGRSLAAQNRRAGVPTMF